jgi:hypothetical protein
MRIETMCFIGRRAGASQPLRILPTPAKTALNATPTAMLVSDGIGTPPIITFGLEVIVSPRKV